MAGDNGMKQWYNHSGKNDSGVDDSGPTAVRQQCKRQLYNPFNIGSHGDGSILTEKR